MAQFADETASAGPTITREIRTGFSPWNEIATSAADQEADLIIMATHGRKGLEKLFLGSTAEKVVEHTPCPVLLLRPGDQDAVVPPEQIESIVFPTDFSEAAGDAAPLAFELAKELGARLTIFHCVEQDVPPPYYAAGITSIFELNDEVLSMARQQMATLLPDSLAEELEHDFVIREGRSAQQLVEYASESAADLVIMATHGYSGLEQAMLGSTTDRVMRNTPCPLLVVRSRA
jgi:nucleotide-binding universal stress UspA family protein